MAPTTRNTTASGESTMVDDTDTTDSSSVYNYTKRVLLAVNFFVETNRMEPFVAVYYITFKDWNPTNIGVVSLVMNIIMLVAQTPVGDILDKTTNKKMITAVAVFIAAFTTTSVAWTSNFWIVLVAKAIEGLAATVFLPALTLLLFGIIKTKKEAPKFVAQTEVSNKVGSLLFTLLCGLMAFFWYPNIGSIFYLLGIGGVIAAVLVLLIPSSSIDDNRARQLENDEEETPKSPLNNDDNDSDNDDDNHDDDDQVVDMEESKEKKTNTNTNPNSCFYGEEDKDPLKSSDDDEENKNNSCDPVNQGSNDVTAVSYKSLLKDKNIAMFALLTFVYHLANAGIVPLVAQYLAIGNEKSSMIFTSAVLLLNFFAQAITAQVMTKAVDKVDSKTLLVLAHLVLPIRCGLLAIMVRWWDNDYAILSTQLLDGIGAGIYDTMVPIVVSKFTVGTGRFGVTFGFIVSCWRVGGGFSYLLAETVWHKFGAGSAFLTQGSISIVSVVILVFGVTVPTYEEAKAKDIARTPSGCSLATMVPAAPSNEVTASNRTPSQTNLLEMIPVPDKIAATTLSNDDDNDDRGVFF
mmetsp:Transcript_62589/g.70826  ORF Transcript_62589/g.70826 Transcript_62589/m.70826 type:complete len:576 (+) Transcript_62589:74-1801(+)